MARKCLMCGPSADCRHIFLYVVSDDMRNLVKIGSSVNVTRRISNYRSNGNTFYRLAYKQSTRGCWFTAAKKEQKALRRLDRSRRVRGDWHRGDESAAIAAVKYALGSSAADLEVGTLE